MTTQVGYKGIYEIFLEQNLLLHNIPTSYDFLRFHERNLHVNKFNFFDVYSFVMGPPSYSLTTLHYNLSKGTS